MALWKENTSAARKDVPEPVDVATPRVPASMIPQDADAAAAAPRPASRGAAAESLIGADLSIEGSISGTGSVRLAGRFTGDVTVDGMVTIEAGAKLAGGVRASTVSIAGELEGNVLNASRVDLQSSGVLLGDLKAETLTLAAGARVRGHVECGWVETAARAKGAGVRTLTPASTPSLSASGQSANGTGAHGMESVTSS